MQKSLSSSMLTWLRSFEAVVRQGHFTRAADELNISQGAVSQQIQQLEQAIGFKLVDRQARPLSLTTEGERLAPVVEAAFSQLRNALSEISKPGGVTPITLSCSPSFAMRWLTPRLGELRKKRSQIDIRIFAEFHKLEKSQMVSEQLQAAIRYDTGSYKNLGAMKFLDEYLIPVASPSFLASHPELKSARDLKGEWLLHDSRPWADVDELTEWRLWLHQTGVTTVEKHLGKRFNLSQLAIGAALAGEGIAMGRSALVLDELESGTLVAPFPFAVRSDAAYHFVTTTDHSVQVDLICDWLRAQGDIFKERRRDLFVRNGLNLIGMDD